MRMLPFLTFAVLALYVTSGAKAQSMTEQRAEEVADSIHRVYDRDGNLPAFEPDGGLDHYLEYAVRHSPKLESSYYRWVSELERSKYVGALPDPFLSYSRFMENVETRVGPQEHRFGLRQTYPWFGVLGARKETAFESSNAAFMRFREARLNLIYRVKSAYYELYYLGRLIQLTRENMELLTFWESVARVKYKVGLKQHPDVIKAQVELGILEDRLLSLERGLEPARANLRAALNVADATTIPVPTAIEVVETELQGDSIIRLAHSGNPGLASVKHIIEKERAGIKLAGKSSYPNFTFGVDYIITGDAIDPSMPESGKDPWSISIGLNLPIWFGKSKARKQEARARLHSAQESYDSEENQLTWMAEQKTFEHNDALRKLRLYRDGLIPKAEQSLNAFYTAYQAGEADFLSVLDAQRQLLEFQLQYERSLTDLASRKAELDMLTGNESNNIGKP